MTTQSASSRTVPHGPLNRLNHGSHRAALNIFMVIVLGHWAEHLTQAYQIWGLGWTVPKSKGLLGYQYPWLVTSEWMHYGYALVMIIGLFLLRPGFVGRGRTWWTVALVIQFWHHIEHLLLLLQAQTHHFLFGKAAPTSVLQLVFARVELHLFYNTIVFIPMVIGMYYHLRPSRQELSEMTCSCRHVVHRHEVAATA
ncbi:hypothetical protein ACGFZP_03480 [Kitasatospora sp. NPDC048239]|uniref:hypothetical protein n=1 Tax=unclassified Kitasatospora TaxID=2633591 RepID=UPI00371B7759